MLQHFRIFSIVLVLITCAVPARAVWSPMSSGVTVSLRDVWGTSSTDVYAVGDKGTILHYNGTKWSPMNSGVSVDLYGISGTGASDIYVTGAEGLVLHWNGTWSVLSQSSLTTDIMYDVWAASSYNIVLVGGSDTRWVYDGTTRLTGNSYGGVDWHSIWGVSPTEGFLVGSAGTAYAYNLNFIGMTTPVTDDLNGVWCSSGSNAIAVGNNGTILYYDASTAYTWTTMAGTTTADLRGVWGDSPSNVFAVGTHGTILHYDGNSWQEMSSNTGEYLNNVWGSSGSRVFAVGTKGTILHYDGQPAASTTTTTPGVTSTTTTTITPSGNSAPQAAFSVNPVSGDTTTAFLVEPSNSLDPEDPISALIVRIDWETDATWDDQIMADGDASHTYAADGTYTITIEVEDTGGLTSQATQQIVVATAVPGNTPPTAAFTISPPSGDISTLFRFDASISSDAESPSAMEYLWDFDGDGTWDTSISTSPTIDLQYSAAGTYTATLEVIDSGGLSATASETLTVAAQPGGNSAPAALADVYPAEGMVGDEFEFSFEGSSDAEDPSELLQGRWDFESDGQWDTDYSDNVSHLHTYADPDLYTATVEVRDTGGLTDQATVAVMVGEKRCALSRAADGDPRVLNALRRFRDETLASSSLGRIVIKTYYRASPAISAVLDKSPALRAVVKSLLQRLAP